MFKVYANKTAKQLKVADLAYTKASGETEIGTIDHADALVRDVTNLHVTQPTHVLANHLELMCHKAKVHDWHLYDVVMAPPTPPPAPPVG